MPCRITDRAGRSLAVIGGEAPYDTGELNDFLAAMVARGVEYVRLPPVNFEGDTTIAWTGYVPLEVDGSTSRVYAGLASRRTQIKMTDPTKPAVSLSGVRNVTLRGLDIVGQNFGTGDLPFNDAVLLLAHDFEQNDVTSTHTGIRIGGASSGIRIEGCAITSFYHGVEAGADGTGNDENGLLFATKVQCCKRLVVMGHTQTKAWSLMHCQLVGAESALASVGVNLNTGADVSTFGGDFGYLIRVVDSWGGSEQLSMSGGFCENILSIGRIGQGANSALKGATFSGVTFDLKATTSEEMAYHLDAFASATFSGCALQVTPGGTGRARIRSNAQGNVAFFGTKFNDQRAAEAAAGPPVDKTGVGGLSFHGVSYRDAEDARGVVSPYTGTL
jgi:hypothetical protein